MRSADLHAKARIRNAAIGLFGRNGFDVSVRAIAAEAGVSPALVLHHFGSKAGLREACDEHVLATILASKTEAVGAGGVESMLLQLDELEEFAGIADYVVAALAAGGALARRLVEEMIEVTARVLREGVAAGTIRPSRDEDARARFLTYSGLGALLLMDRVRSDDGLDVRATLALTEEVVSGPGLEVYTEALFADDRYLRAYEARTATAGASDDLIHHPSDDTGERA